MSRKAAPSNKLARLLSTYEDDLAVRYRPRTGPSLMQAVRFFLRWLDARHVELHEVKPTDLQAYQTDLYTTLNRYARPYSLSSQHGFLTAVKNFYRFLYRRGHVIFDPAASLQLPRRDKRLPRVILSKKEVARLLDSVEEKTPQGYRDRAILETLYATGLRVSELSNLTPYDIDADDKTVRVIMGKGGKDRIVPITDAALAAIDRYVRRGRPKLVRPGKASRFLFLQSRGGQMRRSCLCLVVNRRAKAAGLSKHVTPHTLRHCIATHLLQGRADIRHIQALLGHSCLSTTQIYTRVQLSDLKKVVARAHPRGR